MTSRSTDLIAKEIDGLVTMAEKLARDASRSDDGLGNDRIEELSTLAARGGQMIRRLYGPDSLYEQNLNRVVRVDGFNIMHSSWYGHVSELTGILKGVQRDVHSGLLDNMRLLVRAEVFAEFLEMAEYLLSEGYKDAAAVLLGAVLEDSLRKLAGEKNLPLNGPNGRPLTIEPLNVSLAKAGVFNLLVQKQITGWANLRNDAAHGDFGKYDATQVEHMLLFVQKFCSDFLR